MDVVVVGAGIMGASVALALAARGAKVRVLERAIPGAEAASAAAGILAPRAEASHGGPLLELGLRSLERYPAWVADLEERTGISTGFRRCGVLHVAVDEPGERIHDAMVAGLGDVERLSGADLRRWPFLGEVRDALWLPDEATIDNRELVRALSAALRQSVEVVTGRTVTALRTHHGLYCGVETDRGPIEGERLVIAAGAWTSHLGGPLADLGIKPIRGQMLMLKAPEPLPHVIFGAGRGYLVPRADGRVIAGSTMEDVGFEKACTPAGLARIGAMVGALVPGLADAPVLETWAGFRPGANLPTIGEVAPGLWVASGHHRNGILLAPITADLLVSRMYGDRQFDTAVGRTE